MEVETSRGFGITSFYWLFKACSRGKGEVTFIL